MWLWLDILNTHLAGSLENGRFECQYSHLTLHYMHICFNMILCLSQNSTSVTIAMLKHRGPGSCLRNGNWATDVLLGFYGTGYIMYKYSHWKRCLVNERLSRYTNHPFLFVCFDYHTCGCWWCLWWNKDLLSAQINRKSSNIENIFYYSCKINFIMIFTATFYRKPKPSIYFPFFFLWKGFPITCLLF